MDRRFRFVEQPPYERAGGSQGVIWALIVCCAIVLLIGLVMSASPQARDRVVLQCRTLLEKMHKSPRRDHKTTTPANVVLTEQQQQQQQQQQHNDPATAQAAVTAPTTTHAPTTEGTSLYKDTSHHGDSMKPLLPKSVKGEACDSPVLDKAKMSYSHLISKINEAHQVDRSVITTRDGSQGRLGFTTSLRPWVQDLSIAKSRAAHSLKKFARDCETDHSPLRINESSHMYG